jgi:hypothetical protein
MLKIYKINTIKYIALWVCLFVSVTILYILTNNLTYQSNTNYTSVNTLSNSLLNIQDVPSTNYTSVNTLSNSLLNIQDVPRPLTNFTEQIDIFSHAT